jgi:subtilase family serine protease
MNRRFNLDLRNNNGKIGTSVLIGLIMVLSGLGGSVVGASALTPPVASQSLSAGPLTQVAGASQTGTNPSVTTDLGTYTVVPAPQAFDPNAQITVTVAFKPTADLNSYSNMISRPTSSLFHHYLTNAGVANSFGLSQSDYNSVMSYFGQFGLSLTPSGDRLSLTMTGTPAQLDSAFHTTLQSFYDQYTSKGMWNPLYGYSSGVNGSVTQRLFYSNTKPISLPSGITALVSGVSGLEGAFAQPNVVMPLGAYPTEQWNSLNTSISSLDSTMSTSQVSYEYGGHYSWLNTQQVSFFFTGNEQVFWPATLPALTGAYNLWNGTTTISSEPDKGQGITVAVVEVGCLDPSILVGFGNETFHDAGQVISRVTQIAPAIPSPFGPQTNTPSGCVDAGNFWGWSLETALDVEYVAAMAPSAKIDIIAAPSPFFSAFDAVYSFIGQYLSTGNQLCNLPPGTTVISGDSLATGQMPNPGACNVTITSHSYGSGETFTAFFGSPMYEMVENQDLQALAVQGITNFAASGDNGAVFIALEGFHPAIVNGVTAVGGGSLLAEDNGQAFPNTGITTTVCQFSFNGFCFSQVNLTDANVTGLQGYSYWSYGFGLGGTFQGVIGGGYGISNILQQPWWENGLDVYNAGVKVAPQISGSADFQMTIYFPISFCFFGFCEVLGPWQLFFGGTSFATPIQAGEWALIEEQAMQAFSNNRFGDINPLLFEVHNAYQAGAISINPYTPMQDVQLPSGFGSTAPMNNFDEYFMRLAYMYPQDQNMPYWFTSLGNNPQGNAWSFLGGMGMTDVSVLDQAIVGLDAATNFALANQAFTVLQVNSDGSLSNFATLTGGQTYNFEVLLPNGNVAQNLNIVAYSGGTYTQSGASFVSGATTTITTHNGMFSYTPTYTQPSPVTGASEYGYFSITSAGGSGVSQLRSFAQFAVNQPMATGTLTLGVMTPFGLVTSGSAEISSFTQFDTQGFYTLGSGSVVMLNGQPVAGAVVTQTAVTVDYGPEDPTLPASTYAPGVVVGTWVTDLRGQYNIWTNGFTAELNGALPTQVFTLQASYDGLMSNPITVYIEPQAGLFYNNLHLNSAGTALVGSVTFSDMRFVNNVTISIGSGAGQSEVVTYPFVQKSTSGVMESGVFQDTIPVNFTNLPQAGTPIVAAFTAMGSNDLSFSFCFFGFCFNFPDVQNPITWQESITIDNPGPDPVASLIPSQTGIVSGTLNLGYSGSWVQGGAQGTLTLVSASTGATTPLASGLSGTVAFDSTRVPDGVYTAIYTVTTPTGLATSSSATFYIGNGVAQMSREISSLQSQITTLQAQLSEGSATNAQLQATINSLNSQINSLNSQIASLQAQAAQVPALQAQITQYKAQVASLQSQVNSLQDQLNRQNSGLNGYSIAGITVGTIGIAAALVVERRKIGAAFGRVSALFSSHNTEKNR